MDFASYWSDVFDSDFWELKTFDWQPFKFLLDYRFDVPSADNPLVAAPAPPKMPESSTSVGFFSGILDPVKEKAKSRFMEKLPEYKSMLSAVGEAIKKQSYGKEAVPAVVVGAGAGASIGQGR